MKCLGLVVLIAACSSSESPPIDSQHVRTGQVGYDTPKGWTKIGTHTHTSETTTWTPTGENPTKESVSVIWTKVAPFPKADELDKLLAQGESGLNDPRIGKPFRISSGTGLSGFQIETDYKPFHDDRTYHRVHAVLIDGEVLVHLLYVAAEPDTTQATFRLVLNSIKNEEG